MVEGSWRIDWLGVQRHVNTERSICANCEGGETGLGGWDIQEKRGAAAFVVPPFEGILKRWNTILTFISHQNG